MSEMGWGALAGAGGVILLGIFFRSFVFEKGKNLATKQDIGAITAKIEQVRSEYAANLESAKASLNAQSALYTFRYQREYEILQTMMELLISVRDSAAFFADYVSFPQESNEAIDYRNAEAEKLFSAIRALELYRDQKRPFYPDAVYDQIQGLVAAGHAEKGFLIAEVFGLRRSDYGEQAKKNAVQIREFASGAIDAIRQRVVSWDRFTPL